MPLFTSQPQRNEWPLRAPLPKASPPEAAMFRKDAEGGVWINEKWVLPKPFPELTDSTALVHTSVKGVVGIPIAEKLRNDDVVVSAMLLCFLLMVWLWLRIRSFFQRYSRGVFGAKTSKNQSQLDDEAGVGGSFVFATVVSAVLALCALPIGSWVMPTLFGGQDPTLMMLLLWLVLLLWYCAKLLGYKAINYIFFDRLTSRSWHEAYLLSMLLTSVLLFPLAVALISFNLPIEQAQITCLASFILVKIYLIVRAMRIFFNIATSPLHIILYLCTLESAYLLLLGACVRALLPLLQQYDLETLYEVAFRLI